MQNELVWEPTKHTSSICTALLKNNNNEAKWNFRKFIFVLLSNCEKITKKYKFRLIINYVNAKSHSYFHYTKYNGTTRWILNTSFRRNVQNSFYSFFQENRNVEMYKARVCAKSNTSINREQHLFLLCTLYCRCLPLERIDLNCNHLYGVISRNIFSTRVGLSLIRKLESRHPDNRVIIYDQFKCDNIYLRSANPIYYHYSNYRNKTTW